jgi:L-asparagine transporter-like permease
MTSTKQRWLYYGLLIAAIVCSVVQLFAIWKMGAPKWTTSLNVLSVVLIILALTTRRLKS